MRNLCRLFIALVLGGLCAEVATAQNTLVTAGSNSITFGGTPISTGLAIFTPVDSSGKGIAVTKSGGGLSLPGAPAVNGTPIGYSCAITAGSLATCNVPDAGTATPSGFAYNIIILDTSTGGATSGQSATLTQVHGITGASWQLDHYSPLSSVQTAGAFAFTLGVGAPTGTGGTNALYADITAPTVPVLYLWNGTAWAQLGGSGGSVTATAISTALSARSGCSTVGNVYSPQSNTCIAAGGVTYGTTAGTAAQGNDARIVGAEQVATKGQPNGYVPLDGTGHVPASYATAISAGDVSRPAGTLNETVVGIQGKPVSATAPSNGQVLQYNGSQYVPSTIGVSSGSTTPQGTACSVGQVYYQSANGVVQQWICSPNGAVWTNQTTQAVVYAGSNSVVGTGLTNAYEMNETSGSVVIDEIGSTNLNINGGGSGGAPAFNSGNGYTFNGTNRQYIGLPTSMWATGSTYFVCMDGTGLGNPSGQNLISDATAGLPYIGMSNFLSGNGSSLEINGANSNATMSAGLNVLPASTPMCLAVVYDGSGADQYWIGSTQMSFALMGNTAVVFNNAHPLGLGGALQSFTGHIYKYGYANTKLSADQIEKINLVWSNKIAAALSTTVQTTIPNYQSQGTIGIFPGDSRTTGNGNYTQSYVSWLVPNLNIQGLVTYNDGIAGQTIQNDLSTGVLANFSTIVQNNRAVGFPFPPCFTGWAMGVNDAATRTATQIYADFKSAMNYFQKAGCTTIALTINTSAGANSSQNTVRTTVNSSIVNGGYWNGLVDIANDLRFSNPAIAYNLFYNQTPYSVDGLHESTYGAQAIAYRFAAEMQRIGLVGKGANYQVTCPTAYCDIDMQNGSNQQLVLSNNISVLKVINGNQGSVLNLTITQPTSGGPYTVPTIAVGSGATATVTSGGVITLTGGGSNYDQNFQPVMYVTGLTCTTYPRYSSTITNGAIASISQMTAGSGCSGTGTVTPTSTEPVWNNFNTSAVNALTAGKSLTQRFTFDGVGQSIN